MPASTQERDTLPALDAGKAEWPSLQQAILDGGFVAGRCREWSNGHGMRHHLVERDPERKSFVVFKRRRDGFAVLPFRGIAYGDGCRTLFWQARTLGRLAARPRRLSRTLEGARLILLYLQSEAIRTGLPKISLGKSMRRWLGSMGLSIGGKTYRQINDQARRLAACHITFYNDNGTREIMSKGDFVDGAIAMSDQPDTQSDFWHETVLLNSGFFDALQQHPVPLSEGMLRRIGTSSAVIDLYVWLTYRMNTLSEEATLSWAALRTQFGHGYSQRRKFKWNFTQQLALVLAGYPEANVRLTEAGMVMRPSPTSVAALTKAIDAGRRTYIAR